MVKSSMQGNKRWAKLIPKIKEKIELRPKMPIRPLKKKIKGRMSLGDFISEGIE